MSLHDIIRDHYKPNIPLSMGQIYAIGAAIRSAAPGARVLIFGIGHDSELWSAINFDGDTLFLESDPAWTETVRQRIPHLKVENVSYGDRTVATSLPINEAELAAYPIPAPILDNKWDVIVIDGPTGFKGSVPGRSLPIYWSSRIASAETQIFIDDYHRPLEKTYSDHFFHSTRPWSVVLPRVVDPSTLIWFLGVNSGAQEAALAVRNAGSANDASSTIKGHAVAPVSLGVLMENSGIANPRLMSEEKASTSVEISDPAVTRRALVCFVEDRPHLIQQVLALRLSWLYTQSPDTDLVVMGPSEALARLPDDVVKIVQQPAADDPAWCGYRRVNSVACFNGAGAEQLECYSHIMRTDIDTFITPAWNRFYPTTFTHGKGGYSNNDDVRQRLRSIAAEYGLNHRGVTNIGATWYGPTQLVRRTAAFTEMLAKHIITHHFATDEGKWPGWYRGVSVMYASEIAVNHCVPDAESSTLLDFPSTSAESIELYPHIHCWHTDKKFSKHLFMAGKYSQDDVEGLNIEVISDYCLAFAWLAREDALGAQT